MNPTDVTLPYTLTTQSVPRELYWDDKPRAEASVRGRNEGSEGEKEEGGGLDWALLERKPGRPLVKPSKKELQARARGGGRVKNSNKRPRSSESPDYDNEEEVRGGAVKRPRAHSLERLSHVVPFRMGALRLASQPVRGLPDLIPLSMAHSTTIVRTRTTL